MLRWHTLVIVALLAGSAAGAKAAPDFPRPVGKVNDFARVLSADQRDELEALLGDVERTTTAEIALVTVRDLGGLTVEEYANQLFADWGIGKKGKDNGVLVLVGMNDRAMRIEVGYGLEGVLPDGLAGAIIREEFLPRFREDDYPAGIAAGMRRVVDVVRRNETLSADQIAALEAAVPREPTSPMLVGMLGLFLGIGAFTLGSNIGAKVVSGVFSGLAVTAMSFWFALLGVPPTVLAFLVAFTILVIGVGVVVGRRDSWRSRVRGRRGKKRSGWVMSAGGSGGSSGGSSSGSFGGGRSGGGGASGRW